MSTTWPYAGRGLSSQSAIESVLGYRWTRWMLIVTWLMGHNWIFPQWMILHDDTHVHPCIFSFIKPECNLLNVTAKLYFLEIPNFALKIRYFSDVSSWKMKLSQYFTEWCINQRLLPRLSCQVNFGPGKRVSKLQHRDGITFYRVHHMLPRPRSKKSGSSKRSVINSWIWKRMICHVKWALLIIWLLHHIIQTGLVNVFELNKKILNHNIWHSLQLVIS